MPERQHTRTYYEQQLRELKNKLLIMSHYAEEMIADSISSLVNRRPSLAEDVIERDKKVDSLEIEVDNLCYLIMALEQPVATDLRFVATALKIVKDLERIGDIAVNISERTLELIEQPEVKPLIDLPIMANLTQNVLKQSLDAFVNGDAELAEKIIVNDETVDAMYEQILRELLTYMLDNPRSISAAIKLIFIAKHLERVADHSANIAEMVVFLVRGQDIRHRVHVHGA